MSYSTMPNSVPLRMAFTMTCSVISRLRSRGRRRWFLSMKCFVFPFLRFPLAFPHFNHGHAELAKILVFFTEYLPTGRACFYFVFHSQRCSNSDCNLGHANNSHEIDRPSSFLYTNHLRGDDVYLIFSPTC